MRISIYVSSLLLLCLLPNVLVSAQYMYLNRVAESASWAPRDEAAAVIVNVAENPEYPDWRALMVGGKDYNSGYLLYNDIWIANPSGSSWTFVTNGPWVPRYGQKMVNLPRFRQSALLMITGGISRAPGENSVYTNQVWYSTNNAVTWTLQPSPPYLPTYGHEFLVARLPGGSTTSRIGQPSCAFQLGGRAFWPNGDSYYSNDVFVTCAGDTTFFYVETAPWIPRHDFSSVAYNGGTRVLIAGGQTEELRQNDVWMWDLPAESWYCLSSSAGFPPITRAHLVVTQAPPISWHVFYLIGGDVYNNNDESAPTKNVSKSIDGYDDPLIPLFGVWMSTNCISWTKIKDWAAWPVRDGSAAVVNPISNKITFFGGTSVYSAALNDVWTRTLFTP